VDLAARVEAALATPDRDGGPAAERTREVSRLASRLGSESRELLDRLRKLRGRSRPRVVFGLVVTRGRQRRVAELAREVAASLSEATGSV